jgi:cobalt-precorrin-7 (C5)-methyltransferase
LAKLEVVGVGPGSPDYVTLAAKKAVERADLVVGAQRSLELFDELKAEQVVLTSRNLKDTLQKAADTAKAGKKVVFLSTGDPCFSGLLHTVLESGLFTPGDVNVIPGISSIQVAAACLSISWGSAHLFSFHDGNVSDEKKGELISAYKCGYTILLLPALKDFAPKDIAALLLKTGANPETEVYICENLTLKEEKITQTTLAGAAPQIFGPLCVMVIKQ